MSLRLLAGNTSSTGTPVRACSFSLAQRCSPPPPRGMAALSRPHALIAVDGQPGSHFSQDLARIVVYVLAATSRSTAMGIIWTIVIGFIAGVIAKFLMPGKNEPARVHSHNHPGYRRRHRCHLSRSGSGLVWAE